MRSWNIGFDLGMLNNRLTVSFDWFNRKTINMVGPAPELPVTLGANVPKMNNAEMQYTGFELDLGWRTALKILTTECTCCFRTTVRKILKYPNTTGKNKTRRYCTVNIMEIYGDSVTIGNSQKAKEEMECSSSFTAQGTTRCN